MKNDKETNRETEKELLDLMQFDFYKFSLKRLANKIKTEHYKSKLKSFVI